MDALFTIPYGEYAVADTLTKKIEHISVFIPSSRQEKGIDLLLYRFDGAANHYSTIQVKQSRTYYQNKLIQVDSEKIAICGYLWFNRFEIPPNADWIILTGTRVVHPEKWEEAGISDIYYKPIMLAFTKEEAVKFMGDVKQRTNPQKDDKMFGFCYNENGDIFQTRGCPQNRRMSAFLLGNRIREIEESLK
ncbi:MAG TPA: hypothetical protein DDY98_04470 [Ruminococcaceae bacterium]|nr:hypothetical protein [Oscillospiraceae bacterium]